MIRIKGYESHYAVTREGEVWSFISNKFLKPFKSSKGYFSVELKSIDGSATKTYKVHRLTLKAFSSPLNNHYEVNHIDGNKGNNKLENLEWCTGKENVCHAFQTGLRSHKGVKHPRAKLTEKDILDIRSSALKGVELAKLFKVSNTTISDIRRNKIWTHI